MGCVCGPSAGQRHGSPCDKRQMGRPPALDSGRAKLSLAYGAWRRYSALWLAAALLELPLEVSEEQAVLDYSSATWPGDWRSEEHTSELQSLMRISYAVFCLKKKKQNTT